MPARSLELQNPSCYTTPLHSYSWFLSTWELSIIGKQSISRYLFERV